MSEETKLHVLIGILICIIAGLLYGTWKIYDAMTVLERSVESSWLRVQAVYERRIDVAEDLSEVLHEQGNVDRESLEKLRDVRAQWIRSQSIAERIAAVHILEPLWDEVFEQAKHEPDFSILSELAKLEFRLEETDQELLEVIDHYNARAEIYNGSLQVFPRKQLRGIFGIEPAIRFHSFAHLQKSD